MSRDSFATLKVPLRRSIRRYGETPLEKIGGTAAPRILCFKLIIRPILESTLEVASRGLLRRNSADDYHWVQAAIASPMHEGSPLPAAPAKFLA